MSTCDRCHRALDPWRCIDWQYCNITVTSCLPCCQVVIIALNQVPVAERAHMLSVLKEQWGQMSGDIQSVPLAQKTPRKPHDRAKNGPVEEL